MKQWQNEVYENDTAPRWLFLCEPQESTRAKGKKSDPSSQNLMGVKAWALMLRSLVSTLHGHLPVLWPLYASVSYHLTGFAMAIRWDDRCQVHSTGPCTRGPLKTCWLSLCSTSVTQIAISTKRWRWALGLKRNIHGGNTAKKISLLQNS